MHSRLFNCNAPLNLVHLRRSSTSGMLSRTQHRELPRQAISVKHCEPRLGRTLSLEHPQEGGEHKRPAMYPVARIVIMATDIGNVSRYTNASSTIRVPPGHEAYSRVLHWRHAECTRRTPARHDSETLLRLSFAQPACRQARHGACGFRTDSCAA